MNAPTKAISQFEFIALMAMITATVAFSTDAMLPGFPLIGAELSPDDLNKVQLMLTSFVLGLGFGTFFTGPLADAYGRRPVVIGGAVVYVIGSILAWAAQSLELVLAARVIQGIGSAGPRVAAMAMIRDLFSGAEMARILSFTMVVFSLVPALAPTMGHYIMEAFGWRAIFVTFVIFACVSTLWMVVRQPETLASADRRPLSAPDLWFALVEMCTHRTAALSIVVQTLTFGMLFTVLSSTQQVFDIAFDQGDNFHLWFGGIAVVATTASVLNARIVGIYGMRAIIKTTFAAQVLLTLVMIAVTALGVPKQYAFGVYVVWVTGNFFQAGLCIGNLNALAMEEMGHIAGLAASVLASVATIGAVLIAAPVGLLFDGTPMPMAIAGLICAALAFWLTGLIKRPGEQ